MISGSPRKKSVYAVARARSGKNTGPRRVRATASSSPSTSTAAPHTTSSRRFSSSPSSTFGRALRAYSALKKVSWVRGQPGEPVMTR